MLGVIFKLHGLSTAGMNGDIVEVQEQLANGRVAVILSTNRKISVKPSNLVSANNESITYEILCGAFNNLSSSDNYNIQEFLNSFYMFHTF